MQTIQRLQLVLQLYFEKTNSEESLEVETFLSHLNCFCENEQQEIREWIEDKTHMDLLQGLKPRKPQPRVCFVTQENMQKAAQSCLQHDKDVVRHWMDLLAQKQKELSELKLKMAAKHFQITTADLARYRSNKNQQDIIDNSRRLARKQEKRKQ